MPPATIRRRIARGEIVGVFKQKGARGMEWRIPESSLMTLGYQRADRTEAGPRAARMVEALQRLTESVQAERRRWREWDRRLGWARAEIARLRSELRHERRVSEGLRRELDKLRGTEIDLREEDPSEGLGRS